MLRLQAGARGYLARKYVRLQRQQQADALVLVQVCLAWALTDARLLQFGAHSGTLLNTLCWKCMQAGQQQQPREAAGIVQAAPAPSSSCLPMGLPGLDASPAGIPAQLSASNTTPAAAAAAAAVRGKHSQASGASTPPTGRPVVPAPRPALAKQPIPTAASQGQAASRKPALPVFSPAPPTPVLNARAPRPDSAAVGSVSTRAGPGAGRAVAAGPSILASPGPGSRVASPAPPVVARVASSTRRGRPGLAAGSILGAAVAPGAGSADAGTMQGGQRPGTSSRSRSRSPSFSGEQAGGVLPPQRQSSGGGSSSSHASLPLQRTNSTGSRGVAALAVPPVGTTAACSGMQRTNSGSSQRSVGSSPALPVVGKPPQQAGGRAAARPGSGVSRSAAAGRKAQLPNKQQQQLPAAAKPQPPVHQRQPEGPAAAMSPRRASARLSKAPRA